MAQVSQQSRPRPFKVIGGKLEVKCKDPDSLDARSFQKQTGIGACFVDAGNDSVVYRFGKSVLKVYAYAFGNKSVNPSVLSDYKQCQLAAKHVLEEQTPWDCVTFPNVLNLPGHPGDPYNVTYNVVPLGSIYQGIGTNLQELLLNIERNEHCSHCEELLHTDVPVAFQRYTPGPHMDDAFHDLRQSGIETHLLEIFLRGVWEKLGTFDLPRFVFSPRNVKIQVKGKEMRVTITDFVSSFNDARSYDVCVS